MAKAKKIEEPIVYLDKLGQELSEGNYVVACHRNTVYICRIIKINKVMLRVSDIRKDGNEWLVYPNETVKLSGEVATLYILKYA